MSSISSVIEALASVREFAKAAGDLVRSHADVRVHGVRLVPFRGGDGPRSMVSLIQPPVERERDIAARGIDQLEFYNVETREPDSFFPFDQNPHETLTMAAVIRVPLAYRSLIDDLNMHKGRLRQAVSDCMADSSGSRIEPELRRVFGRTSRLQAYRQIHFLDAPTQVTYFWSKHQRVSYAKDRVGDLLKRYSEQLDELRGAGGGGSGTVEARLEASIRELKALGDPSARVTVTRPKPPQLCANVRDAISEAEAGENPKVWHRMVTGSAPLVYAGDAPAIVWPGDLEPVREEDRPSDLWEPGHEPRRGGARKPRSDRRYRLLDREGDGTVLVKKSSIYLYRPAKKRRK